MADAVNIQVLANTRNRYVIRISNRSDGTGETNAIKVDKSTLNGPIVGVEPGRLAIERVEGDVDGMQVQLNWDHTTDDQALTLAGPAIKRDFRSVGGLIDPASAGATGDLLLTTLGHTAGDSYDLTIHLKKKA